MARLEKGENAKIDRINDLVEVIKDDDMDGTFEQEESIKSLLETFKPLLLKLCKKWSNYFNDDTHRLISFGDLMVDCEYWFVYYTKYKYTIDGVATFNTFIKNHMDMRIRYIYEQQLKYYKNLIFPDPDRRSDEDGVDVFESVIYNYSSKIRTDEYELENDYIENDNENNRKELAHKIEDIIRNSCVFNDREKQILINTTIGGVTQDEMGKRLGISRTRVTQILRKSKTKLYKMLNESQEIWDLVNKTDIEFKEI